MRVLVSVAVFGLVPARPDAVTRPCVQRAMRTGHDELEARLCCMLCGERMATREEIAIILTELKEILKQS